MDYIDEIWQESKDNFDVFGYQLEPQYTRYIVNNICGIANMNIERMLNKKVAIGTNLEWQAGGMYASSLAAGLYVGVKF